MDPKQSSGILIDIVNMRQIEDLSFEEIAEELQDKYDLNESPDRCEELYDYIMGMVESEQMPDLLIDMSDPYIANIAKKVQFIDIETSLVDARVFGTGKQNISIGQLKSGTRLLSAAGGSMYDLYTKGYKGVWGVANNDDKEAFEIDPLDDTLVLRVLWEKLDEAEVVIAHNSSFDMSRTMGRFLALGWKLPSPVKVICTYGALDKFFLNSKKLDYLSKTLVGTKKISTDFGLWMRCSDGDSSAFDKMLEYNKGDIYDTLFKMYMRTAQYNPDAAVDLSNPGSDLITCKVTGGVLVELEEAYYNKTNGLWYRLYINPINRITYVDRYNVNSKKSGMGFIKAFHRR